MTSSEPSSTRFDFRSGPLRGTTLALQEGVLTHRGTGRIEAVPLRGISAVRVAFERDGARMQRALILFAVAAVLYAASAPLASLAAGWATEIASQLKGSGGVVGSALLAVFRGLQAAAKLLPTLGHAFAAWGAVLLVLGWWGTTTLTLTLAAVERDYSVRGRNLMLFDFAEALSDRLLERGV